MQPIQYVPQPDDPFKKALIGLQIGTAISDFQTQQQSAEKARLLQEQYSKDAQELFKNPTADALGQFAIKYPTNAEKIISAGKLITDAQKETAFNDASKIYSSISTGNIDYAKNLIETKIKAFENSGKDAGDYIALKNQLDVDPKIASATAGFIASSLNPEKFLQINKAPAEISEAVSIAEKAKVDAAFAERLAQAGLNEKNWSVKNLQSQISDRAQKLNLDRQITQATVAEKLSSIQQKAVELPADTRKLINESATLAATAKQSANQMEDLANRIEGLGGYGAATKLSEFAKTAIGAENYETSLRQEYTRLRNTAGMKSLPPGPATDKDVQIFFSGYPKDTSDSKLIAQFLRGMAKMQNIDSSIENAKTDWLAQNNGTLTRAKSGFIAGDYAAKAGETFNDFSQRVTIDAAKKYIKPKESSLVSQIPTETTPTAQTAAPVSTIRSQADAILRGGK